METSNIFGMQIFLLCLMVTGIIAVKLKMVDEHSRLSLSDLVLNIFLPCNILSSFFGTDRSRLPALGMILVISFGTLAFSFLLSRMAYRKAKAEEKKVLLYATIVSNASFLGNPVVESIYGLAALSYAAVYLAPIRLAVWSVGFAIFSGQKNSLKKIFFHPCLVATYLGILVMITGFTPPALISRLAFSLGNCSTPVSMMVAGSILALVNPKKIITPLTAYYTFIRLVLIPFVVMGVMVILRPDPVVSGVSIVLSGTPAAVTTSILTNRYGGDRELASKIIFLSTLLSIVTMPALVWLLRSIGLA